MGDGAEGSTGGVSEGKLLLGDVCWISESENKREALLGVCGNGGGEADEADFLVEKICVEVKALLSGLDGFLE